MHKWKSLAMSASLKTSVHEEEKLIPQRSRGDQCSSRWSNLASTRRTPHKLCLQGGRIATYWI